jgi:hypothetical protein
MCVENGGGGLVRGMMFECACQLHSSYLNVPTKAGNRQVPTLVKLDREILDKLVLMNSKARAVACCARQKSKARAVACCARRRRQAAEGGGGAHVLVLSFGIIRNVRFLMKRFRGGEAGGGCVVQ